MSETEKVEKRYRRLAGFYDLFSWPFEVFARRLRKKQLSDVKGRILEVGVGTGKNLQFYPKNCKVTAIDISRKMLARAIKKAKNLQRDYSFLVMDAQNLKFKDDSFDYVVCSFVLCSVPDPVKALKEMKRVCKKNGRIIMLEHVLSKNKLIAFFEKIHNPLTRLLLGFNINRDTPGNVKKAGLEIIKEENVALGDVFKIITCKK